ncbi:MAG: hypothetical protein QMC89_06005 [Candidatus Hodarchaeaceae archaeon]|nr:hypothetical protein [Candidatus Hodarchaeaceae archaeon]
MGASFGIRSQGIVGEKRGVSVVLGAIIVLAILFVASSAYIAALIPSEGHQREREHMEEVKESFLELKSAIDTLELLGSRTVDVKMAADPMPVFQGARSGGRLSVEPAGARFLYAESLGTDNTTSTSYQDKVVLTFTPPKPLDYLIIASAEVAGSATTQEIWASLEVNGVVHQELRYAVNDPSEWYPLNALKRVKLSSPSAVKIRFKTNTPGTASIRSARIVAWAITCEYAENENEASRVGVENRVTLKFTPSTAGDYLIIATANITNTSTSRDTITRLLINGIEYAGARRRPTSTTAYYSFGNIKKVTLQGGSESTIVIQYESAKGTAKIKYAHVAAIRLDQLPNSYYAENEAPTKTLPKKWIDKVANTYVSQEDHLILGTIHLKETGIAKFVGAKLLVDGITSEKPYFKGVSAWIYESTLMMDKKSLAAGGHQDKIQYYGESAAEEAKFGRLMSLEVPSLHHMRHGVIRFDINNVYYVDQTWVYELGAVILAQDNASVMVSRFEDVGLVAADNGDIRGNPLPGDNIRVEVHFIRVKRFDTSVSSMGTSTIMLVKENSHYEVENSPRENVTIRVNSTYRDAWAEYLSWLVGELNARGYNASFDDRTLRLTILGKRTSPGVSDILYYERVTEIEVSLA